MNEKLIKDFINAVKSEKKKPSPYDTSAKVVRVDGDTAWVHIAGGVDETPAKMTTSAKAGDEVQVRVSGGRAFIIGNATAPPTDDTKANEANDVAVDAEKKSKVAKQKAENAEAMAQQASTIANNTNQYFWHTETGNDTGAHITEIPKDEFIADPENGGGNLLARSNGIAVRNGLIERARFSSDEISMLTPEGVPTIQATNDGDIISQTVIFQMIQFYIERSSTKSYKLDLSSVETGDYFSIKYASAAKLNLYYYGVNEFTETYVKGTLSSDTYSVKFLKTGTPIGAGKTYENKNVTIAYDGTDTITVTTPDFVEHPDSQVTNYFEIVMASREDNVPVPKIVLGGHPYLDINTSDSLDYDLDSEIFNLNWWQEAAGGVYINGKLSLKKLFTKILGAIYGIKPYILNSRTTFASAPPIKWSNYDSGLKTIAANSVGTCDATVNDRPSGYTGYIVRCRVQNGTGGVNESGCCPYNFYFINDTTVRASVSNRFSSQAKVHVHFTVLWVNPNML